MSAGGASRFEWVAKLTLAAGSFGFCWLLLELPGQLEWVRYYHWGDKSSIFLAQEPWRNPTLVMDADRFFRRRAGTHLVGETPGDMAVWLELPGEIHPFDVFYDELGFRNRRPSDDAAIAVIGDSFVEVPLLPDEGLLAAQLERALGLRAATFGHLGYGPQQELDILRDDALAFPRKWIVWVFFEGNDLADYAAFERRMPGWARERALKRSLAYTIATKLAPSGDVAAARARAREQLVRGQAPTAGGGTVEILLGAPGRPWDERGNSRLAAALDTLAVAQRESRARGAGFLAVFVPTKERVYHEVIGGSAAASEGSFAARFLSGCEERGIAAIDVSAPLRERAREELVYLTDDAHWNAAGVGVAATEIARAIRAHEAAAAR